MAFNHDVAERLRSVIGRKRGFSELKMFGGIGFLLNGNVCCGVWKNSLILRVGPDAYHELLAELFVGEFDITGRPMTGWVLVQPEGFETDAELAKWFEIARSFVSRLPAKK